jgi:HK97 family phage major capsid protein
MGSRSRAFLLLSYPTVANGSHTFGKVGYVATGDASGFKAASASDNPADALIDLYYALKQGYRANAAWVMSDATMSKVRKWKDADGNYIWAPPADSADVAKILGKPVHTDDNMPAVGANALPIAFGDFQRGYIVVDRAGIRVLRDNLTSKPNVKFYTTKRVGGGIGDFDAIKLLKCASA